MATKEIEEFQKQTLDMFRAQQEAYLNAVMGAGAAAQAPDAATQMHLDVSLLTFRMFGEARNEFRLRENDAVDVWLEASGELPESIRKWLTELAAPAEAEGADEIHK